MYLQDYSAPSTSRLFCRPSLDGGSANASEKAPFLRRAHCLTEPPPSHLRHCLTAR